MEQQKTDDTNRCPRASSDVRPRPKVCLMLRDAHADGWWSPSLQYQNPKYLWIFLDLYASHYEKVLLVSSHWPETCHVRELWHLSLSFSSIKLFSFPQSLYQRIHIGQHPPTLWHFYWQNSTQIFPKWKCWSALIAKAKMLRSNQTLVCQNSPGEGQVTHASLGSLTLGLILQHFAWLCYRTISYILDCYNVLLL